MLFRKAVLLVLLMVILIVPSMVFAQDDEPVELVIWVEGVFERDYEQVGEGGVAWQMKQHDFEAANPGVTVVYENHGWDEALRQNLLTAFLGGNAPDIVVGGSFFNQYANLGALVPLDDVLEDIGVENVIPGTYAGAVVGDSVYGLSGHTGVFGFERNCSVIEAAGYDCDDVPETWDALLLQAKDITEAGDGEYYGYTLQGPVGFSIGSVLRVYAYMASAGATLCKNECQDPYFNDPNAVQVYEFLREINQYTPPGLTFNPDEGQVYTQLFNGVSAYQMAGSWHPGWATDTGCTTCEYSPIPHAVNSVPGSVIVGNVIYAVLSTSDNIEPAKDWIRFFYNDSVQDQVWQLGRIPVTYDALERYLESPDVTDAEKAFGLTLRDSEVLLTLPSWPNNPQEIWTVWNDMFTRILTTDDPIAEILDEAQVAAEEAAAG